MAYIALLGIILMISLFANGVFLVKNNLLTRVNNTLQEELSALKKNTENKE